MGAKALCLRALLALSISHRALGSCVALDGARNLRFCDNTYSQADCVEAGCNYDSCGGSFRRRVSSFFDTDYGGGTSYGVGFVCLERCDPGPAAKTCEQYSDFDCPLRAGCAVAPQEPQALPGTAAGPRPPSGSSSTSAVENTDEEPLFEGGPVPEHATPASVGCAWFDELGCSATLEGEEGRLYLLLRLIMAACLADTADDGSGCSNTDMLDFCINGEFPDYNGAICLPIGSNFTSGAAIMRQAPVFGNCTGVAESAECTAARDVIFGGLNCPFCGEVAELVAPAQAQCAAIRSEQQCPAAAVVLEPTAVSDGGGSDTEAEADFGPAAARQAGGNTPTAGAPRPPGNAAEREGAAGGGARAEIMAAAAAAAPAASAAAAIATACAAYWAIG